jgi:hypothetical protein
MAGSPIKRLDIWVVTRGLLLFSQGRVTFTPNEKGCHWPSFGAVPLVAAVCENLGLKPVPFAHMSDYHFYGDSSFHLLARSPKSVYGKMFIPKVAILSCPGIKTPTAATSYPISAVAHQTKFKDVNIESLAPFFQQIVETKPVRLVKVISWPPFPRNIT